MTRLVEVHHCAGSEARDARGAAPPAKRRLPLLAFQGFTAPGNHAYGNHVSPQQDRPD